MKNDENKIFSETEKTVIFIHAANQFIMDNTITSEAIYIRLADEELRGTERSEPYYLEELRKAARSDKNYIIMEFDPFICDLVDKLIKSPEYDFWRWHLYVFFHADTCPPGEEPSSMHNLDDEKLGILWPLYHSEFILKYTIPVGHTLTLEDLHKMRKDFTGPETVKELRRLEWSIRKGIKPKRLSFPFYEIDNKTMKEFMKRRFGNPVHCRRSNIALI